MTRRIIAWGAACASLLVAVSPSNADQVGCQRQILKQLIKFEKNLVKAHANCLNLENLGKVPGPCPDAVGTDKIAAAAASAVNVIGSACTAGDLTTLGFSSTCADYGSAGTAAGAICASAAADTPSLLATCLVCWKEAALKTYVASLYASHAEETCGTLDDTSAVCEPPLCSTPLPDQGNLGESGGDSTCQKGIGTAGLKTMLKRAKTLTKCGLLGGTQASCLGDPLIQAKLTSLGAKMASLVKKKCGNRNPEPSPVFCCRTGAGNECTAAADRDDCTLMGFTVQEGKFCDVDSTCASLAGDKQFTWWDICPDQASCIGPTLGTTEDISGCVASQATRLVDRLLCLQIRRNGGADWPCPASASGAFVD